jgi:hypothetical protein
VDCHRITFSDSDTVDTTPAINPISEVPEARERITVRTVYSTAYFAPVVSRLDEVVTV